MACPYFFPEREADFSARPRPARAPLGTVFSGTCRAGDATIAPPEAIQYEQCNFGYGRGVCPWFPPEADTDAVRFSQWRGAVAFIFERDHFPVRHGDASSAADPILRQQIAAFNQTR